MNFLRVNNIDAKVRAITHFHQPIYKPIYICTPIAVDGTVYNIPTNKYGETKRWSGKITEDFTNSN